MGASTTRSRLGFGDRVARLAHGLPMIVVDVYPEASSVIVAWKPKHAGVVEFAFPDSALTLLERARWPTTR